MKKKPPPIDFELFHRLMKDITPLTQNKIRLSPSSNKKIKTSFPATSKSFANVDIEDKENLTFDIQSEQILAYKHLSLSHKIFRKLRKGQYNIEAVLDLHKMTTNEAKTAVEKFLSHCLANGNKVVLIVHGKGSPKQKPILKNKLNQWLKHLNIVLAFSSAMAYHGGLGAVYVLLKSCSLASSGEEN